MNSSRVSSEGRAGIGLAILSAVLFGASTPFAKTLVSEVHPLLLAGLLYLGSGAGLAALLPLRRLAGARRREAPLRLADLPWLVGAIVTGGVAGPALLMFGLRETTASAASLLLNLEGLATMGVAWLVFRENVDRRVFVGAMAIPPCYRSHGSTSRSGPLLVAAALMGLGVYLHLTERHEHEHEHEELLHEHAHVHDEHHRHRHEPGDPSGEPHVHRHRHAPFRHKHPHYPDLHHRHVH